MRRRQCLAAVAASLYRPASAQAAHLDTLVRSLERDSQPADQFVLSQFRHADLVLLGEDHGVRQVLDFVSGLVPALYRAGVRQIGMEFGAEEQQARIDAAVRASVYDEQAVREALWDYNVGWPYVEYQDVVRAAWAFNRSLAPGKPPFRVINLSYRYDWRAFERRDDPASMARVLHRGPVNHFRAQVVARETLARGQKMLLLVGMPHAYSRFRPGQIDLLSPGFCRYQHGWLGQLLLRQAPGRVRTLLLHQPWPGRTGASVLPAGGLVDAAMAQLGERPCGFGLGTNPAGQLTDDSGLAVCHPGLRLRTVADGYVFLAPLRELRGCRIDENFFAGHPWAEIQARLPDPDWHGSIGSLEAWWARLRSFVDIPARYAHLIRPST